MLSMISIDKVCLTHWLSWFNVVTRAPSSLDDNDDVCLSEGHALRAPAQGFCD